MTLILKSLARVRGIAELNIGPISNIIPTIIWSRKYPLFKKKQQKSLTQKDQGSPPEYLAIFMENPLKSQKPKHVLNFNFFVNPEYSIWMLSKWVSSGCNLEKHNVLYIYKTSLNQKSCSLLIIYR